jgi:pimeloyl-ACP methyl ester carboxylesterase
MAKPPPSQHFEHNGRRIAWREYGSGPRVVVLLHGLLMDGRMFVKLAPELVARGYRVLTVDMLGHGDSGVVRDMTAHSMTLYGQDVIALLDHLNIPQAVVGGTSLGANISLEVAVAAPDRVRALLIEMPVLENGLAGAGALFVPLAFAIRINRRGMNLLAAVTRLIPRTLFMVDLMIDFVRRDPETSLAILDGITFGRVAPPATERKRLKHPALVIGHARDPIHPFSDADMLAHELAGSRLVEATSILEWRIKPSRLDHELCDFLAQAWAERAAT